MDDIFYEKILYRILQGRLRLKLGDLVLYVYEPSKDLLEESIDIYEETYNKSYFSGVPIKSELLETLFDNNLWSPDDDKRADEIDKQIEQMKVEAFKNFLKKKKLRGIKMNLRMMEGQAKKYRSKRMALDHTSCEGAANFARSVWITSKTTKNVDGSDYDWYKYTISHIMEQSKEHEILGSHYRKIARSEPWRSMWLAGTKQGNIFNKPSSEFTKEQSVLCSFSNMYDNIYESPDAPDQDVIEDDDCLDGWMIEQKRESEKNKKKKQAEALIKNPKIANSDEIFIMATEKEEVDAIYGMNDPFAKNTINRRNAQIDNSDGNLDFRKLQDVKQDMQMQSTQGGIAHVKNLQRSK